MAQNRVEKIVQRYALGLSEGHEVQAGDFVRIRPVHVMTHDNTGAVMPKFESLGASKMHDPAQPVFALDHDVQNTGEKNLAKYAAIEAFAAKHGVTFYPAGRGIGHQLMIDEGHALPGSLVVASDSHSNTYGGVGALGTPVVRTDAAAIWATGETWWQVPEVVKVELHGRLPQGLSGKDVIIALCGFFNADQALNCAVEFHGEGLAGLSMDQRLAIANMSTEWGALAGVFTCDAVTEKFLLERARVLTQRDGDAARLDEGKVRKLLADAPEADADAHYGKTITLDLATVTPHVSGPDQVKTMHAVGALEKELLRIDRAYLLSCTGARLEDFAAAAAVLKGQKVAEHVTLYVAAASGEIEQRAREAGHWQVLVEAGAKTLPPGCGACIGLGEGLLEPGEVGISATNRNFKGRMGSRDAKVYLASPAVVAASAAAGHIAGPVPLHSVQLQGEVVVHAGKQAGAAGELREGFPSPLEGRLLWLDQDNLNTDGIYGKDYTYRDDMTPAQMAEVAMENHDPKFQQLVADGDILVGGYNFGSGSSREQAATALKYRGVRMVLAGSFSQTYKRNAFNNGFVVVECPALVEMLRERFSAEKVPTRVTGLDATVDFVAGRVEVEGQTYRIDPLGTAAQDLIVAGGLEAQVHTAIAVG